VYGFLLCPRTGRVLVQDDEGSFSLPGGKPEPADHDLAGTLAREAFAESRVRVGATAYLGYQHVSRPGRTPYAQVRMVGVIDEFAPRGPEPDGVRVRRRLMTSLGSAPSILGWGLPGIMQSRAAARVARVEWGLPVNDPAPEGYEDLHDRDGRTEFPAGEAR
jgi:8-oxo-dGTP diphosphatase